MGSWKMVLPMLQNPESFFCLAAIQSVAALVTLLCNNHNSVSVDKVSAKRSLSGILIHMQLNKIVCRMLPASESLD